MLAVSLILLVSRRQKDRIPENLALDAENASLDNEVGGFATATERDVALGEALEVQVNAFNAESEAVAAELQALDAGVNVPATKAALREKKAALERIQTAMKARGEELSAKRSELLDRIERRIALQTARREKTESLNLRTTRIVVGVMAVIACAILFSSFAVPWLPTERIESHSDAAFTGYVLNETDGDLVVLRASDRIVIVISSSNDPHRTLCDPTTRLSDEPLINILRGDSYPSRPRR